MYKTKVDALYINGEKFTVLNEFANEKYIALVHDTFYLDKAEEYFSDLLSATALHSRGFTYSAWNPYLEEYGWPPTVLSCGCLNSAEFHRFIKRFHDGSHINTPWPNSNALLVDKKRLTALTSGGTQINLKMWLNLFPLGSHYISLSTISIQSPSKFISLEGPGLLNHWVSKQNSNFTGGIIPKEIGRLTREAWIEDRAFQLGKTYIPGESREKVLREIKNLRGLFFEESFCCTKVVKGTPTMFLTPNEKKALRTMSMNSKETLAS